MRPAGPVPPGPGPGGGGGASRAPELRRLLLRMMVLVVALHATAIAVYRLADVAAAASPVRTGFTVVWMVATFALVSVYLRRIRALRRAGRR